MDRFVARQNIQHFRHMLKDALDPQERARVEGLLREAEERLRTAEEASWRNLPKPTG